MRKETNGDEEHLYRRSTPYGWDVYRITVLRGCSAKQV